MRHSRDYHNLPFNPRLKENAKALRKAGNLSEVILWQQLHKGKFKGCDFDRQKIIGDYIVDFYCPNHGVVIEVDGDSHNEKAQYDQKRDEYLEDLGLVVIHILAADVLNRLDAVMRMLHGHSAFCDTIEMGNE